MKRNILFCLFCILAAAISASAQTDLCFENAGLKVKQTVRMILINNTKIEGVFETSGYEDNAAMQSVNFDAVKKGRLLSVIFDGKKTPYETARGTKSIVWTLGATTLKIPIYGKNYNTNKYSTYPASFDKCKED